MWLSDNQHLRKDSSASGYLQKTYPTIVLYGCETWSLVLDYLRAFGKEVLRKTSDLPPTSNRKTKNTNFTQKKHSCYLQQTYHQGEQMVRTNKLLMMKYEQIKISYKFLV